MKAARAMIVLTIGAAIAGCASPAQVAQPAAQTAPPQADFKGCYYAGERFSVGSVKPSMTAATGEDGQPRMIDDPKTAIPMKCIMQFDGVHTTYAWVIAGSTG